MKIISLEHTFAIHGGCDENNESTGEKIEDALDAVVDDIGDGASTIADKIDNLFHHHDD